MADSRQSYERHAFLYEYGERFLELFISRYRRVLFSWIGQNRILEVGVGSGRTLTYYKSGTELVAGDQSRGMMRFAQRRALSRAVVARFCSFDVQNLPFRDRSFPAALSSLVFCSVENPLRGLEEVKRVLEPSGILYMIEHVRPRSSLLGWLFDILNVFSVQMAGEHFTRSTQDLVREAGFRMKKEYSFANGVFRLMMAQAD